MRRQIRRALVSMSAFPLALGAVPGAPATAATVLAMEGTAQIKGNAQTAFKNEFCAHNTCRSINNARTPFDVKPGSRQLHAAVQATPGDIILMGYSLGAASIYDRLREWEKDPGAAPDPARVLLVLTYGNPENRFGGDDRKNSYAGLPEVQPYPHLDVTMQYDSVADNPARWGWYSRMNLAFAQHIAYFQNVDINNPANLIYRDGDGTTYMLIPATTLPMLQWMKPFVTAERMAELDAKYRPLIEKDYDRPAYVVQGEGADWGGGTPPPTVAALDRAGGQADADRPDDPGSSSKRGDAGTADDAGTGAGTAGLSEDADDVPDDDAVAEVLKADAAAAAADEETDTEVDVTDPARAEQDDHVGNANVVDDDKDRTTDGAESGVTSS